VFPEKQPYYPRPGRDIRIVVGDPLELEPYVKQQRGLGFAEEEIRRGVADILAAEMLKLKTRCEHPDFGKNEG